MIVTLCSIRGAPGVTSWSLLLAAAWPSEAEVERVVIEADPAGGVLGARYGLGVEPGVASFVAGLRRRERAQPKLAAFARLVGDRVWVMPEPEVGERARAVWEAAASPTVGHLAGDRRVWVVDGGRLDRAHPCWPLIAASTVVIVVVAAHTEDLVQVPATVELLRQQGPRVGLLVCGRSGFGRDELTRFSGADVVWLVDAHTDLVASTGLILAGRRGRRSWLWRQAVEVAVEVAALSLCAHSADRVEVAR